MDRSTLSPRSRALVALGACAVLLGVAMGTAAARADLRLESAEMTVGLTTLDDERTQDRGHAVEADETAQLAAMGE